MSRSFIPFLLIFFDLLSCNKAEYPRIIYTNTVYDIKTETTKLYELRDEQQEILIGGYRWGMSVEELSSHLYSTQISDFFMPNYPTCSNITIGKEVFHPFIMYGFSDNTSLSSMEMQFEESISSVEKALCSALGDRYLKIILGNNGPYHCVWYTADTEYHLFSKRYTFSDRTSILSIVDTKNPSHSETLSVGIVNFIKSRYKAFVAATQKKKRKKNTGKGVVVIPLFARKSCEKK